MRVYKAIVALLVRRPPTSTSASLRSTDSSIVLTGMSCPSRKAYTFTHIVSPSVVDTSDTLFCGWASAAQYRRTLFVAVSSIYHTINPCPFLCADALIIHQFCMRVTSYAIQARGTAALLKFITHRITHSMIDTTVVTGEIRITNTFVCVLVSMSVCYALFAVELSHPSATIASRMTQSIKYVTRLANISLFTQAIALVIHFCIFNTVHTIPSSRPLTAITKGITAP